MGSRAGGAGGIQAVGRGGMQRIARGQVGTAAAISRAQGVLADTYGGRNLGGRIRGAARELQAAAEGVRYRGRRR